MEIEQAEVSFVIQKNEPYESFAIVENPNTPYQVVRSPFNTEQEARTREMEIAEYWGFKAVETK